MRPLPRRPVKAPPPNPSPWDGEGTLKRSHLCRSGAGPCHLEPGLRHLPADRVRHAARIGPTEQGTLLVVETDHTGRAGRCRSIWPGLHGVPQLAQAVHDLVGDAAFSAHHAGMVRVGVAGGRVVVRWRRAAARWRPAAPSRTRSSRAAPGPSPAAGHRCPATRIPSPACRPSAPGPGLGVRRGALAPLDAAGGTRRPRTGSRARTG